MSKRVKMVLAGLALACPLAIGALSLDGCGQSQSDYQYGMLDAGALGGMDAGYWGGSSYGGWADGGNFYGNSLLGTAVSSSGDSGYIALGDGDFVSW